MNRSGPSLPMVKSPISLPRSLSIGVSTMRPCAGILFGHDPRQQRLGPVAASPRTWHSRRSPSARRRSRTVAHSRATCAKCVGAAEGDVLDRLGAVGREPERVLEPVALAEHGILAPSAGRRSASCAAAAPRQFLVGEADAEAPRIVLAHLGVGVGQRRPVAVARDVHRPHVEARDRR